MKYKISDLSLKIKQTELYRSLKIKKSKNEYFKILQICLYCWHAKVWEHLLENILSLNPEVTDMGEVNFLEESIKEAKDLKDVYDLYEKNY